jgi:polyadenylate-binding protein
MSTVAIPQQQPVITQQAPQVGVTPAAAAGTSTSAPQTTGGYHSASLFVGDLHPDVTESFLFDIFKNVGSVASIRVCRDHMNRQSLGYAYVNYHNVSDAERALEIHNFHVMKGKPCRIMWSQRDPALRKSGVGNIFVKNLDPKIDNKSLFDTFSLFGNILSCKVATDAKGLSKGYGYVHYETLQAAQEAIEKINKMVLAGQTVEVGMFTRKSDRVNQSKWTNVYVKNIPKSWDAAGKLQDFFGKYGTVTSVMIKAVDGEEFHKGFGFVNFEDHEGAKQACEDSEGLKVQDGEEEVQLVACRAQKKAERDRDLAAKYAAMKKERLSKYQGVNVYVKNLDDEIDDEFLQENFSVFGSITSAKVMRDEQSGVSKGFGFVCFSKPEEAQAAIAERNNKVIKGKPIYVALAQRKEVRKAQIQQQRQQRGPMGAQGMGGQMPPYNNHYMYQQQRGMMYPQPMMARGAPRNMYMRGAPSGYMPYALQQQAGPIQGGQQQGGRRRQQRSKGAGGMQRPGQQGQYQYTSNVRNPGMQQPPQQMQQPPQQKQPVAVNVQQPTPGIVSGAGPLTLAQLTSADPDVQKNMIGERLYPLIQLRESELAGKITGMLLEMENAELLNLLESPPALESKIHEALEVLRQHRSQIN